MDTVAAIGADSLVRGFALAGAMIFPAEEPDAVRAAWAALPADVAVVVLSPAAAAALADRDPTATRPLVAVMT